MTEFQVALLERSLHLLVVTLIGGFLSAWAFRKYFNLAIILISFATSVIMIFVANAIALTGSPMIIYTAMFVFGGCVAVDLGGLFALLGLKYKLDPDETMRATLEVLMITFGVTIIAALIGLFSGINFQGLGTWLFAGLWVLIGLGVAGIFGFITQSVRTSIGIGASFFWVLYMIYDFNKAVNLYTENTWPAAVHIAMSVYLDMVNFLVYFAEIYFSTKSD
jgi:FtsH-binding integral membrane protein